MFLKKRYHLTSRETQVAILICRGFTNEEISEALRISESTVKTHLKNLYRRVRVDSRILLLLQFVEDFNKAYGKTYQPACRNRALLLLPPRFDRTPVQSPGRQP